jgi:hypothetical protein
MSENGKTSFQMDSHLQHLNVDVISPRLVKKKNPESYKNSRKTLKRKTKDLSKIKIGTSFRYFKNLQAREEVPQ